MAKPQQQQGAAAPAKAVRKRTVKVDAVGQVHVNATFNNVIITFTNNSGQTVAWSSAGKMGFRGAKKNTPFAAQVAAQDVGKAAFDLGIRKVKVYIKGPGAGRDSAIRNIGASGIEITEIMDITPLPHNGCRPRKRRKM
jgi:small subunit ribosomal protein S11